MEMEILPRDDAIRLDKSATPKIIFGLALNGAWKGWDLNVFSKDKLMQSNWFNRP